MVRSRCIRDTAYRYAPLVNPGLVSPVDPLSTLTLFWVYFVFWAYSTLLQINISHTDGLIGCGGKEYDYAFPLLPVK